MVMPFFLATAAITLLIDEAYVTSEYSREGFPLDPFGLTNEQREEYAIVAVRYLESTLSVDESIGMLEELQLPGDEGSLFNEREIDHMVDVKKLTDVIRLASVVTGTVVIGGIAVLYLSRKSRWQAFRAMFRGGLATSAILLGLGLFIVVGWQYFFVFFHEALFPPGSWTFSYSDGLIRLFPERFFFDWGVLFSLVTLGAALLVTLFGWLGVRAGNRQSG